MDGESETDRADVIDSLHPFKNRELSRNEILANKFKSAMDRFVKRAIVISSLVMASLMVISALTFIYECFQYEYVINWYNCIAFAAMLFFGLGIILDKTRNIVTSIGLFAMGLGIYKAFIAFRFFIPRSDTNVIVYIIFILGINMAISGYKYVSGKSRSRVTLKISSLLLLSINILIVASMLRYGMDYRNLCKTYPMLILTSLMYVGFVTILDTEILRSRDWMEIHSNTISRMRRTYYLDSESKIATESAELLSSWNGERKGWMRVDDGGPAEYELRIPIINGSSKSYIIAQIWRDYDGFFITMSDHYDGTIIQASRMAIDSVEYEDDVFRINNKDGTFSQFELVEEFE